MVNPINKMPTKAEMQKEQVKLFIRRLQQSEKSTLRLKPLCCLIGDVLRKIFRIDDDFYKQLKDMDCGVVIKNNGDKRAGYTDWAVYSEFIYDKKELNDFRKQVLQKIITHLKHKYL